MKSIYLSLPAGLYACIISNTDIKIDQNTKLLAQAYVPGLNSIETKPKKIDFTIKHVESTKKQMLQRGKQIIIYDIWQNQLPPDVYHLLYSKLRVELLKKRLFSVHAACVGNKDVYYLVVGHTGVGKTTVTLGLVEQGMKVFSGNKTIGSFRYSLYAVAGTTTITMKSADSQNYHSLIKEKNVYGDRCAFALDLPRYSVFAEVRIKGIFVIRLNDGLNYCQKLNNISALHTLYPYFFDTVNADTVLCDGKSVFVGTPPAGSEEYLAQELANALKKIPVYLVTGSKSFIINKIMHQ